MPAFTLRASKSKRSRRGVKARRRTELGLLAAASVIVVAAYTLMILGNTARVPSDVVPLLVTLLGLGGLAHIANRLFVPDALPVILPIAFLLNGLGYVMILRIDLATAKSYAPLQAAWTAAGIGAYVLVLLLVRRSRDLDRYRYLFLTVGVVLLLLPLVPHVGANINGARLWIHFGSVEFEPVELGLIVLCIFFAAYFAEKRELLTIPTARLGNRLFLDPRPLVPIAYLVFGILLFAVGAYVSSRYFAQTHIRVETWLDPWKVIPPSDPGGQLREAWYALGSGGIGGSGLGLGFGAYSIPNVRTDFIFAAIGEEMGLLGSTMVVVAFLLLVGAGLRVAQAARSEFAKLTATGLTIIIGFQAFFIIGGVVRLLPLTGITLPFVSYGGSALIASYVLIALLMRISDEGSATIDEAEQTQFEQDQQRRQRLLTGS